MRFREKVVWITGASSGIGEALAYAFSREGAHLVLSARRQEQLEQVRDRCTGDGKVLILPFDITHTECHPTMVGAVIEHFGRVDILVNNAGISQRSLAQETRLEVDRRIMEVNFFGVISLTKATLPFMLQRGSGHLVVISSLLGKFGIPLRSAYCASKHALHGFFDALRAELHDHGIRVTLICPGWVRTEVSLHALRGDGSEHGEIDPPIAKGMDPTVCARHILNAVYKRKEEVYIAGGEKLGAYLKRFTPSFFNWAIRRVRVQ